MTLHSNRYAVGSKLNLIPMVEKSAAIICLFNPGCRYHRNSLRFLIIDLVGNIVVFIPFGMGVAGIVHQDSWRRTISWVMGTAFMISLTIEILQLAIPSRATDVDDLIFNSLGAVLGAVIFLIYELRLAINRNS
jgi:glycopeptide antibiotics resistance protein